MPAIFSFPHTCRAVRRVRTGTEDGTPTWGEELHPPITEEAYSCFISVDTGPSNSPGASGVATRTLLRATVFIEQLDADIAEDDHLDVTTNYGDTTTRWRIDGVTLPETSIDPDHFEIFVSREVNG